MEAIYESFFWITLAKMMQYDTVDYKEQLAAKILKYIQDSFKIQMIAKFQGWWYSMMWCRLQ